MQEATKRSLGRDALFSFFCLIMIGVSAIDSFLNLKYPVTTHSEENPLARAILYHTNNDRYFLISLKVFTTGLVTLFVAILYRHREIMGMSVAAALAIIQLILLFYMLLY